MNINNKTSNISYTGRCSQIRDAQWVCRTAHKVFPHISSTKIEHSVYKFRLKDKEYFCKLKENPDGIDTISILQNKFSSSEIFDWYKRLVAKLRKVRKEWGEGCRFDYRFFNRVIGQLKYEKLGNCGEDAYLSEVILKLNGIDNACAARLQVDGNKIDHAVCVFNRDGSTFDGKAGKNTIIIDAWLGDADFASNMFVKYKNLYKRYFPQIKPNSKIGFQNVKSFDLSGEELLLLSLKYDNLLYPSCEKLFMH